jgi:site-specific DNA-adenine methylase
MTSYNGGKQRIGKKIADQIYKESIKIENNYDFTIKGYCEPFCGMLGVYKHIPELFDNHRPKLKYKAGDVNKSVIMMWQSAQRGWNPPTKTTEKEYNKLKNSKDSALRGYIGHQYSFGGQFFNGYAPRYGKTKDSSKASENVIDISEELFDVQFKNGDYKQYSNLKGYIIYCDPPYENTHNRYRNQEDKQFDFDSEDFWKWCKYMSKNNIIFISSYKGPKGLKSILTSSHKLTGISPGKNNKQRTEKLYMFN